MRDFDQHNSQPTRGDTNAAAGRAPLAAAAVLGVLAGGAAFLAFAMTHGDKALAPQTDAIIASSPAVSIADEPRANKEPAPAALAQSENTEGRLADGSVDPVSTPAATPDDATSDADVAGGKTDGGSLAPRLKPSRIADASALGPASGPLAEAAPASAAPAAVLSLATHWVADESDRPPPFFSADDLASRGAAQAKGEDADLAKAPQELRVVIAKGENFVEALSRAGIRASDRNEAAYAFGKLYNMRRLRPGQEFALSVAEPSRTFFQAVSESAAPPAYLISLEFRPESEKTIRLTRRAEGGYSTAEIATPLTTRIASIEGPIIGSLYVSAKKQGAPDDVIASLAQMFAYDVDFQREIFGGDEFEALFEVKYDDTGKMVGGGEILYGRLKWRGRQKEKGYYRFAMADAGERADYFDASGESARRLLMKTPIDGARLSSGFGTRKHPILGYQKAHKGVDFAASRGTPIMAAGDGVIERAGPYGTFGNYVRIRHAQGYKTAYAHMNSIKKGVKTGARVRQGDIIGYVGTTGRSTGPHLHYEVHLKDVAVNPQNLKIATGYELTGAELKRFKALRDKIDAMRAPLAEASNDLVADKGAKNKAL